MPLKRPMRSEKERRWREIAKSLQMPVAQIKTRALSLRTQYSRLIKPKPSGSVNKSYTARQRWLLRVMDFLKQYIVHRPCEFTRILPSTVKEETDNQDECDLEKYSASFEHSQEPSRPASPSTASPSHSSSPLPSPGKELKARGVRHGGRTAFDVELQKLVVLKKLAATVNADSTCDAFTTFGNQDWLVAQLASVAFGRQPKCVDCWTPSLITPKVPCGLTVLISQDDWRRN
ncbi:hypothetical protein GJAV_G00101360 [Gymnothorax javanicus]|nr:hypothetical protein GJAV_G00101360 [Gymnothorax javanicus]